MMNKIHSSKTFNEVLLSKAYVFGISFLFNFSSHLFIFMLEYYNIRSIERSENLTDCLSGTYQRESNYGIVGNCLVLNLCARSSPERYPTDMPIIKFM